jgi:hypothetical protein
MRAIHVFVLSALLSGTTTLAQSAPPDLSGRWRLVQPTAAELSAATLTIDAPDELLISQTQRAITIEHPSKPGTHPQAGTFRYGVGGNIGAPLGNTINTHENWGVTHIGTQLMISRSIIPDENGIAIPVTRGSMWRLEAPDRLVIEFGEERPGQRPKIATRVYVKVAGQ